MVKESASCRDPGVDQASASDRRPLRIALVTETYPPEINGVASTVAQLVGGLTRSGHHVELVRPYQAGVDDPRSGRAGLEARSVSETFAERLARGMPVPGYAGLRMGLPATGALHRAWVNSRPDVVHIATEGPLGWSALRAALRAGLPVVSEFRTNFHAYSAHYGLGLMRHWVLAYLRRFHNRCGFTMVPTRGLASDLEAIGFDRLRVVARGVDARRFNPSRRSAALRISWGAGPEDLVVLSVGRLAPEKNLELLASSFLRIKATHPGVRLVVVGDGPARPWLEERLPGSTFAGRRSGVDLAEHYASADLLLFPSLTETFGNVTLEAMASGLAVVAFDYGAARLAVRHGVHGWLASFGDPEAFVGMALRAAGDVGVTRGLGAEARRAAESMAWDEVIGEVLTVYREAIRSIDEWSREGRRRGAATDSDSPVASVSRADILAGQASKAGGGLQM